MPKFDAFLAKLNSMIVNPAIELLFAVAIAVFLWGVVEFIANQDQEEKRTDGKKHMLWGVIGLVIMMGVFAIMNLVINTLGVQGINPETGDVKKIELR